jgi:hypothetical protein
MHLLFALIQSKRMKHAYLFLLATGAALTISSCRKSEMEVIPTAPQPATATAGNVAKMANGGRPFKGSMTLQPSSEGMPCACVAPNDTTGTFAGSGNLSHLGLTSIKLQSCATPIVMNNMVVGFDVNSVCATMKTADGDELFTKTDPYQLLFTASGASATLDIEFTGGTGKFVGAGGGFTGTMTIPPTMASATLSNIDGTIIY